MIKQTGIFTPLENWTVDSRRLMYKAPHLYYVKIKTSTEFIDHDKKRLREVMELVESQISGCYYMNLNTLEFGFEDESIATYVSLMYT